VSTAPLGSRKEQKGFIVNVHSFVQSQVLNRNEIKSDVLRRAAVAKLSAFIITTSHNRALACGVSLSNAAQRIHQFANRHRARPAAAVRYRTWVN